MDPASTCGPGYTCALVCDQYSRSETLCYAAGSKEPGEACTDITGLRARLGVLRVQGLLDRTQPVKTCRQFLQQRPRLWRRLFVQHQRFLRHHERAAPHLLASLRPHRELRPGPGLLHLCGRDYRLRLSVMMATARGAR